MTKTTEEDVAREVAEMKEDIERQLKECEAKGEHCPAFLMPLFKAGHWLGERMEADGATVEQAESATFALGQRVAMGGGAQNAYRLAAEAYDRWRAGRPDRGGRELADQLIAETVKS